MCRERALEPAVNEDTNRNDVGPKNGHKGKGADSIERNRRSNVDKRKKTGDEKCQEHCIKRDVPTRFDLEKQAG